MKRVGVMEVMGLSGLLLAASAVTATLGSQNDADPRWNYWAVWSLCAAGAIVVLYFVVWPTIKFLDSWSAGVIDRADRGVSRSEDLKIIHASYHGVDLTATLKNRVAGGVLDIPCMPPDVADPALGVVKTVTIQYRWNRTEATATFRDGERIVLPPPA